MTRQNSNDINPGSYREGSWTIKKNSAIPPYRKVGSLATSKRVWVKIICALIVAVVAYWVFPFKGQHPLSAPDGGQIIVLSGADGAGSPVWIEWNVQTFMRPVTRGESSVDLRSEEFVGAPAFSLEGGAESRSTLYITMAHDMAKAIAKCVPVRGAQVAEHVGLAQLDAEGLVRIDANNPGKTYVVTAGEPGPFNVECLTVEGAFYSDDDGVDRYYIPSISLSMSPGSGGGSSAAVGQISIVEPKDKKQQVEARESWGMWYAITDSREGEDLSPARDARRQFRSFFSAVLFGLAATIVWDIISSLSSPLAAPGRVRRKPWRSR